MKHLKLLWFFETLIESMELNELQGGVIFSYRRILDQNLCAILDLKANKGRVGNPIIFFKYL